MEDAYQVLKGLHRFFHIFTRGFFLQSLIPATPHHSTGSKMTVRSTAAVLLLCLSFHSAAQVIKSIALWAVECVLVQGSGVEHHFCDGLGLSTPRTPWQLKTVNNLSLFLTFIFSSNNVLAGPVVYGMSPLSRVVAHVRVPPVPGTYGVVYNTSGYHRVCSARILVDYSSDMHHTCWSSGNLTRHIPYL
jgi:hypothetical protein